MTIEPRMELKIGTKVTATDGDYGHLHQLFLDPHQERVVAILVRPNGLPPSASVVVPVEHIVHASEDEVELDFSREQVNALPKFWGDYGVFVGNQKYAVDNNLFAVRGERGVEVGRAPSSREAGMIEYQVTASESEPVGVPTRAGQQVYCKDGYAGRTSMILMDPGGKVKGFVLHIGHFPPTNREVIVPVAWIHDIDRENVHLSAHKHDLALLPDYSQDYELKEEVNSALWADDVLRANDYKEISITMQDGIVGLRGHVGTPMNKIRAEDAARSVSGILGVENNLVVDQDLVVEVAQALGKEEQTRAERISVGAQNGVITLEGKVNSVAILEAAESIAASVPQVRGVVNYLQAPGMVVDIEEQRAEQPPIGQDVYTDDMLLGRVEKVIINPTNRRVTAFLVHGFFPNPLNKNDHRLSNEDLQQERLVVIPTSMVRFATESSVLLNVSGFDAAENHDYVPDEFVSPPAAWVPPYPYRGEEVLFENSKMEERSNVTKNF